MGRKLTPVLAAALICGCATQPPAAPGTGSGAAYVPMVDMQGVDPDTLAADAGACREMATRVRVIRARERNDVSDVIVMGVGLLVPFGLVGMAVVASVAAGFQDEGSPQPADDALQQKTLINCMARKGYRNLDPNVTVAYVSQPPAVQQVQAPPTGRDSYVAESYAKSNICPGEPAKAVLASKGPGFERHSVSCGNGQSVALRCEFGNCAPDATELALRP
ncbi:MAG TPA: hypothetical protein VLJ86_13030 [Ramlibacter sp.]|nr:hypothetical protein [Ramlibacter sp.]